MSACLKDLSAGDYMRELKLLDINRAWREDLLGATLPSLPMERGPCKSDRRCLDATGYYVARHAGFRKEQLRGKE